MTRMQAVLMLALLGSVAGCGDSDSPTSPTPAAPTPRTIAQGGFSLQAPTAEAVFFGAVVVTDPSPGNWEATVDWTFATNMVWMYVANGTCTAEQFASDACPDTPACPCQFTVRSEVATPKPRILSIPNAPGGTRTLIVLNLGPREESGTYAVRLTPTTQTFDSIESSGTPAQPHRVVVGRKKLPR